MPVSLRGILQVLVCGAAATARLLTDLLENLFFFPMCSGSFNLGHVADCGPQRVAIAIVDEVGKHAATVNCTLRFFHSRTPGEAQGGRPPTVPAPG